MEIIRLPLPVKNLEEPAYANISDAGMDLQVYFWSDEGLLHPSIKLKDDLNILANVVDYLSVIDNTETISLMPGHSVMLPTGICCRIPHGYEIAIRERSSTHWKHGLSLVNKVATIDSGFIGEICVILKNDTQAIQYVKEYGKYVQAILKPVCLIQWKEVESLGRTDRMGGGFGSTTK